MNQILHDLIVRSRVKRHALFQNKKYIEAYYRYNRDSAISHFSSPLYIRVYGNNEKINETEEFQRKENKIKEKLTTNR